MGKHTNTTTTPPKRKKQSKTQLKTGINEAYHGTNFLGEKGQLLWWVRMPPQGESINSTTQQEGRERDANNQRQLAGKGLFF